MRSSHIIKFINSTVDIIKLYQHYIKIKLDERNINEQTYWGVRADITVSSFDGYYGYACPNFSSNLPSEGLGKSSNPKVLGLLSAVEIDEILTMLAMDYPAYYINKVVRLDTMLSANAVYPNSQKGNNGGGILACEDAGLYFFSEADIDKTIPVQIYIDIVE